MKPQDIIKNFYVTICLLHPYLTPPTCMLLCNLFSRAPAPLNNDIYIQNRPKYRNKKKQYDNKLPLHLNASTRICRTASTAKTAVGRVAVPKFALICVRVAIAAADGVEFLRTHRTFATWFPADHHAIGTVVTPEKETTIAMNPVYKYCHLHGLHLFYT